MTVSSEIKKVTVNGNGSATVFSFSNLVINDPDDLEVTKRGISGGKVILTRGGGGAQYTVNVTEYPGTGTVTYPSQGAVRLESGEKLVLRRKVDVVQPTDLENQGGYFPEVLEATFDYGRMIDLTQQEELDRSLKLPVDASGSISTELPLPEANMFLKWNSEANAIVYSEGTGGDGGGGEEPEPTPISGILQLDDGSASGPTYSFASSPMSGWYWNDSSEALQASVEGNRIVSIDADRSVYLSTIDNGNPALRTIAVTSQTRRVNLTGSIGSDNPSILAGGASSGNAGLRIGAEPGGHGRLQLVGVTPMGVDVTEYGITKDVNADQSTAIQDLAEWLRDEYGGATLIFPQGDYYFHKACNLPSATTIQGQGTVRFMMGKQGVLRCAGNYAFDDTFPNARLRSTTSSGTAVWHIDTAHSGGVISRFDIGSKWRVRGAGGGDIEVRDRIDVTVASTDGVDDVTTVQNADVDYLVSWDPNVYPEAAAYEDLYAATDYTYMDKFVMTLLLQNASRGVDQTIQIPTDEADDYLVGDWYFVADDQEEIDVAGTLHNRGNIEIVCISLKTDLGANVTELTLSQPLSRSFTTARGAAIFKVDWVTDVHVKDIKLVSYEVPDDAPASRVPMVEMRYVRNWSLTNVTFNGTAEDQAGRRGNIFRSFYAIKGEMQNCYASYPGYTDSGEGYLFSIYNSRAINVNNCTGVGGRHNFLTQVGTDITFSNCFSYDCKISDFDAHGVNEVGLVFSNLTIKQSELRSDGSNASVAAIRLGNTSHPLGAHDITISNINIFGNGSTDSRGIDIVPPSSNISISNVKMNKVYDGIYCRSNLDEDLVAKNIRIADVYMNNVGRYGIAMLGDADVGFTGYQINNVTIDGMTIQNTNRAIIGHEIDTLSVKNVTVFGLDQVTAQTSFDFDDVVDLDMQNTVAFNVYRGWSLTDCPNAYIFGGQVDYNTSILVDNGGNTNLQFFVGSYGADDPTLTDNSVSTGRLINIPNRQVEYLKADTTKVKIIRAISQATYDGLTPDPDTFYVII